MDMDIKTKAWHAGTAAQLIQRIWYTNEKPTTSTDSSFLHTYPSSHSVTTPNEDGIRCHHRRRRSRPPLSCPPSVRLLLLVLRGCTAKANEHPLPQLLPHSPSKSSTIRVTAREQQRRRCRSTRCRLGWSVVGRSVAIPHPRSFCFNFYIISTPMFSQRVPRSNLSIHLSIYPTNHPSTHSLPTLLPPSPRVVFVVRFLLALLLSTSPFRILSSYSATAAPSARYSLYELLKNAPRTYYMPSHPCLIHRICPWKLLLLSPTHTPS